MSRHARAVTGKDAAGLSAEETLDVRFPEHYANWLQSNDGLEREKGGSYLSLYPLEDLVERNRGYALAKFMPGLILIGTDGGGDGIGLDVRGESSPVVLVNLNSLGWDEAIYPGESCEAFLVERLSGHSFRGDAT